MDERRQLSPPPAERRREASPARALAEQREQVKRFVSEIADAADIAEQEIATSVNRLLEDLSADHAALQEKYDSSAVARYGERSRQLEERERELAALEETLRRRESESAESWKRFEEERRRHQSEAEEAAHRQTRNEERRRRLEKLEEELEAREQQTKNQRRRIAAELREERETVRRERRRDAEELQRRADDLDRLAQDLQRRSEQIDRRAAETMSVSTEDDDGLRHELHELEEALAARNAALHELTERCDDLRARLGDYKSKLAEAEARAEAAEANVGDSGEADQWRRHYEEAQEEIRELKRRPAAAAPATDVGGGNDWESQKRRILAALETDFEAEDPDAQADRLTIEGTIRITDGVVAQKDEEIAELKRQLSEGAIVVERPPNFDDAVARDEYLAARRVEIDLLKIEWEQKVREAEVEMSLERAKLGRERSEFEDRRAEFEQQQARAPKDPLVVKGGAGEAKPAGGRWLARLGLREKDEG